MCSISEEARSRLNAILTVSVRVPFSSVSDCIPFSLNCSCSLTGILPFIHAFVFNSSSQARSSGPPPDPTSSSITAGVPPLDSRSVFMGGNYSSCSCADRIVDHTFGLVTKVGLPLVVKSCIRNVRKPLRAWQACQVMGRRQR